VAAGFVDFEITWRADVFAGAPQSSSAANFGTLGINFRARKARDDEELLAAMAALSCEVPMETRAELGGDAFYDAGDRGCAEGPLDAIAGMLRGLQPGQTLEIRATEPSVGNDLPAWCRLAGHTLLESRSGPAGDRYLVRRKD
jgi:tRNA 2-thiouridine synthesizing protein A